jgi:dihydropteroate synthase
MQDHPTYGNVVAEVGQWLNCCRDRLVAHGIKQDRIALDPGIGFGKTHEHNRQLVQHCHEFHESGSPLVVGPSRKAFIGKLLGDMNADRDPGTAGIVLLLASQGVQVVRVHNVGLIRQALDAFEAAGQDELFRSFKEKLAN